MLPQSLSAFPQKHSPGFISLTKVLPYLGPDPAEEELHLVIGMQFHHQLSLVAAKDTQHSQVHFIRGLSLFILQAPAPLLNFMCKADDCKSGI